MNDHSHAVNDRLGYEKKRRPEGRRSSSLVQVDR